MSLKSNLAAARKAQGTDGPRAASGPSTVPTIGNRSQHHPGGTVGNIFRQSGGRLLLGVSHSGDCFQNWMVLRLFKGSLKPTKAGVGLYGPGAGAELVWECSVLEFAGFRSGRPMRWAS
jgi:hypothetical protein